MKEIVCSFPESFYQWPSSSGLTVRGNFVVGADNVWSIEGSSHSIGGRTDWEVFNHLRSSSDAIVVGGGTARAENYFGTRITGPIARQRSRNGQNHVPDMIVIGGDGDKFDPRQQLFWNVHVPTRLLLPKGTSENTVRRLMEVGARVHLVLGDDWVIDAGNWLKGAGFSRVLLEGGPTIFDAFAEAGLINECCVTRSPVSAAPGQRVEKYRPTWLGDVQRAWVDEEGYVGEIRRCRRPLPESDTPN